MSCYENPEECRGCPYCIGYVDPESGRVSYPDVDPATARAMEFPHVPAEHKEAS